MCVLVACAALTSCGPADKKDGDSTRSSTRSNPDVLTLDVPASITAARGGQLTVRLDRETAGVGRDELLTAGVGISKSNVVTKPTGVDDALLEDQSALVGCLSEASGSGPVVEWTCSIESGDLEAGAWYARAVLLGGTYDEAADERIAEIEAEIEAGAEFTPELKAEVQQLTSKLQVRVDRVAFVGGVEELNIQ